MLTPRVGSEDARPFGSASVGADKGTRGPGLLDSQLFCAALVREHRRSDRFGQSFAVLLVAVKTGHEVSPAAWDLIGGALDAARRDTDLVGWLERGSVLGMILTDLDERPAADDTLGRVRDELSGRLDVAVRAGLVVRQYYYPGLHPQAARQEAAVDSLLVSVHPSKRTLIQDALKRGVDVAGSIVLLVLTAPLMALIAALVKLGSPGPVLFRQERVGHHGKAFTMLKFRTMHADADDAVHQKYVGAFIASAAPPNGGVFKMLDDPRVTPVGRVLRRTSFDELPQLWNVLRGEMSLVGPRPPIQYEVAHYKPWHRRRLADAKPGITGLWQVTGRSRTTFDDMVRLDIRYARSRSLVTDLKILAATLRAVNTGDGAH